MNNGGIALLELIIVVVIVGILAVLGLPNYTRIIERQKGKEAETSLELIYNAEKRYYLDNSGYFICTSAPCTTDEIKNNLGIGPARTYFTYSISQIRGSTGFTATATRKNEGICKNNTMSITESGGAVQKGCDAW